MVAVQLVSAQIGRVTGKGLARNMDEVFHPLVVTSLVFLLFIANTINVGADLAAMGSVGALSVHLDRHLLTVVFALLSLILQISIPYRRYANILKWLTLVLFSYVGVLFFVHVNWLSVARNLVWPQLDWGNATTTVVAVFGTTISPYMFFWQSAQEVEEIEAAPEKKPLKAAPRQAASAFARIRLDTFSGMAMSNIVGIIIMICTAATLNKHGVTNIQTATDAAKALEPLAGHLAFALFSLGIVGTGLLAVPVLAGSAAYAVGESRGWECGLDNKPWEAVGFYSVIGAATIIGVGIDYSGLDPMRALFWSAVINGFVAVPLMVGLMLVASRRRQMGKFTITRPLAILGWAAAAVMAAAAIAMVAVH